MRKLAIIISAIILLLLPSGFSAAGQNAEATFCADSLSKRFSTFSSWCSPEKVYLHLDRAYYASGENIWFSGYVSNASSLSVLPTSNYIYAELLDGYFGVVDRVKIKKGRDGEFAGCIELSDNIESGYYTLRAYTLWQINSDPEYMFHQRVKIIGPVKPSLKEKQLRGPEVDVTFYPEGGRYFAGTKSRIGFRVLDRQGRSIDTSGELIGADGSIILPVGTLHDGMGAFEFIPEKGVKYFLTLGDGKRYPLPEASADGLSLRLMKSAGDIYVEAAGPAKGQYTLVLRDISSVHPLVTLDMDGRPKLMKMPASDMASGINQFLLVDSKGSIVSSRLYYSYPGVAPVCDFEVGTCTHTERSLVSANVYLADSAGKPLDGHFSVSVVRGSFKDFLQDAGVVSFMGLTSELKGAVNDPDHYFDSSVPLKTREMEMDLLMMIQGWTYYDMPKFLSPGKVSIVIRSLKEFVQSARVKIERVLSSKMPKNYFLNILIPRLKYFDKVLVDKAKYITLDSLDFEEGTQFVLDVERSSGMLDYIPKWSGDRFAPTFRYSSPAGSALAVTDPGAIPLESEVAMADTLKAAVVTATAEDIFGGGVSGRLVSRFDMDFYKDRSLVEYVSLSHPTFSYNGENMVNTRGFHGGMNGADQEPETGIGDFEEQTSGYKVSLIVDGNEEPWYVYENVYLEDIAAISITTQPDLLYGGVGGSVNLKLKRGVDISRNDAKPSLLLFVPLGYQVPRYFYSPRYDRGESQSEFDHRNTVYWNPCVKVARGLASIEFCDTDQMDYPYIVRIEGVDSKGRPFSLHTEIR